MKTKNSPTFAYLKNRHATQCPANHEPIVVTLFAQDRGDYGFIYEDYSAPDAERYNYLFFTDDEIEPHEHFAFDNAPEAILHFAYRFIIDNNSHADTDDPKIQKKYDTFCNKILAMCKFFH